MKDITGRIKRLFVNKTHQNTIYRFFWNNLGRCSCDFINAL